MGGWFEWGCTDLQGVLDQAVQFLRASDVSLLLQLNEDLDASQLFRSWNKTTHLHNLLGYQPYPDKNEATIEAFVVHGGSIVTLVNDQGISPIEIAAATCKPYLFELFWDSAVTSTDLMLSPKIVEKVLCSAISARNQPIIEFLIRKLSRRKILLNSSLLEFAICQDTTNMLEILINQGDRIQDDTLLEQEDPRSDSEEEFDDTSEYENGSDSGENHDHGICSKDDMDDMDEVESQEYAGKVDD